jgi:hypothetical protein
MSVQQRKEKTLRRSIDTEEKRRREGTAIQMQAYSDEEKKRKKKATKGGTCLMRGTEQSQRRQNQQSRAGLHRLVDGVPMSLGGDKLVLRSRSGTQAIESPRVPRLWYIDACWLMSQASRHCIECA